RLGELSTHPGFARLIERGLYLLSPMREANLRAAIEGPARQAGLRVEPGLVDLLVREVEGEPGALPMLSHVLRQTWERREGPTLTVDGYRATGGIRDAVAQSAEHLFAQFDDRQQGQVRALFLRLVMPGDDGAPTRARVPRRTLTLDESHEHLIDLLAAARLVSTDEGDVQIAHEALAREWPRLRGWLEDDVEGQRIFRHLATAAEAWDSMHRPDSELYRGVRLAGATEWADKHLVQLTGTEQSFLDASRVSADRELRSKARTNRRLRLALAGVGALLVVAVLAGVTAVSAARRAEDQARIAVARQLSAQALSTVEPDLAVLLGLEAVRLDNSRDARSALDGVLEQRSELVAVVRGSGFDYVDVSPDGRSVAVSSASGTDAQGQTTYDAVDLSLTGIRPGLRTLALAYSPRDGRLVVAASGAASPGGDDAENADPHPVRVLDAQTLAEVGTYDGFVDGAYVNRDGLKFSADGSRLAAVAWVGDRPAELMVWDTEHPAAPVFRVSLVPRLYGRVELSPDGKTLYFAQRSGAERLRAFDVDTGSQLLMDNPEWRAEREGIIALSPDGTTLARSDADGVAVLDARTFERRYTLVAESEGVSALDFGPDGSRLAAGYADGTIIVWDVPTRGQVRTLHGHTREVTDLAFNPDGETLYSVAPDRLLLAWDVGGSRGYPGWRAFDAQPAGFDLARSIPSPDGTKVLYMAYGGSRDHRTIEFRDLTTGEMTPVRDVGRLNQVAWSPDSSVVLTAGSHPDEPETSFWLQAWDPETGEPLQRDDSTDAKWFTFTRDGSSIVAVGTDRTLRRVDPQTLQVEELPIELPELNADDWEVPVLAPDDRTLLVRHYGALAVAVVDLTTGTARDVSFDAYATTVALSPDGGRLAVFYDTGTWGVVDVAALREARLEYLVPVRPFPSNYAWEMAYSADGKQIITTGNGVVELWDAATLEHVRSLNVGSRDDVATPRAMADGYTLVVAHPRGQVLTWDTRPQHLLDVACRLAGRNLSPTEWEEHVGDRPYEETCPDARRTGSNRHP
ncbi:MAG: hypothetical protein ABWY33_01490, partial [Cellulomonas sp.]